MLHLDVQNVCEATDAPKIKDLCEWVDAAIIHSDTKLTKTHNIIELTIRIVHTTEMIELNHHYRGKNSVTNVLSFPFEYPPGMPDDTKCKIIGDIIICNQVMHDEVIAQNKTIKAHWAHLIIHGTLHLLGYDHINDIDAAKMEQLETKILIHLKFPNPYTNF